MVKSLGKKSSKSGGLGTLKGEQSNVGDAKEQKRYYC